MGVTVLARRCDREWADLVAGDTIVTVVGNLTADPELRYTQNGLAVANFTIASTPRVFDRQANEWKDGDPLFLRCSVWREFAEHVASSLVKGSRVIVQGRLKMRRYETESGEKRTSTELEVEEIGPSLRYATAQLTRTSGQGKGQTSGTASSGQNEQQRGWYQPDQQPSSDQPADSTQQAWGGGGNDFDEPPF